MDIKHEGWSNYETWCVSLWITNEEPAYRYWTDRVRSLRGTANKALTLAGELEAEIADGPHAPRGVYSDLLTRSLRAVNWLEIARDLLSE